MVGGGCFSIRYDGRWVPDETEDEGGDKERGDLSEIKHCSIPGRLLQRRVGASKNGGWTLAPFDFWTLPSDAPPSRPRVHKLSPRTLISLTVGCCAS